MAIFLWILPTAGTIALRNTAFALLVLITLWSVWRDNLPLHLPLARPWLAYGLVAMVSLSYAMDPLLSLNEIKHEVGQGILILMLMTTWIRTLRSMEFIMAVIVIGDFFLVGSILLKITMLDPFWHHPLSEISARLYSGPGKSIYNGVGNFSTYLVTVTPFIAAYTFFRPLHQFWTRNSLIILLLLNILAIFLTGNRMGLVALAVETIFAVSFLAARSKLISTKTILAGLAIVLALIGGLTWVQFELRPPADDPRWPIWAWGLRDIIATPLTGSGFGRTTLCLRDPAFCSTFQLEHVHNMVLNKGVQMGVPGIAAFLFLLSATIWALWPSRVRSTNPRLLGYSLAATAMSFGVFIKNMTDDFFVNHNALIYWALVGAVLGVITGETEKSRHP